MSFSYSTVILSLLERQQGIISGKIKANKDNLIGVNIKAAQEPIESVPYLPHLDYNKAVREFTEFVDFTVLNLADETQTSGVQQYYKRGPALDKLLS